MAEHIRQHFLYEPTLTLQGTPQPSADLGDDGGWEWWRLDSISSQLEATTLYEHAMFLYFHYVKISLKACNNIHWQQVIVAGRLLALKITTRESIKLDWPHV